MNLKASLLSLKDNSCLPLEIKDPISVMQKYLSYFFYARQTISPLKTSWAKVLLLGIKNDFEKILIDENQPNSTRIQDAYEKWLERRGFCFDAQTTWNYWTPIFQDVFSELIGSL